MEKLARYATTEKYSQCIADSATTFNVPLPYQCTLTIKNYVLLVYYLFAGCGLLVVICFVLWLFQRKRMDLLYELEQMSAMESEVSPSSETLLNV